MPNWINHRGTLRPFTLEGTIIIQRLLENKNTHNWFGNSAPLEVQVQEDSLPIELDKDTWLKKYSAFTGDFSSEEYSTYLENKYGFISSFTPLTFGVKWGACNPNFRGDESMLEFSCRTPYGVCTEFYQYLSRNGIDVDVICDGEMDGKYIFKSRGGEYTEHYTASGDLCY